MQNIIYLFENQNKIVLNLTQKINYIYQFEKHIIKNVQDEKYKNTCFILEINKLDDIVKQYIHEKYKEYDLTNKYNLYDSNEWAILFYKRKFIHFFVNEEKLNAQFIEIFIKYADDDIEINKNNKMNGKQFIMYCIE